MFGHRVVIGDGQFYPRMPHSESQTYECGCRFYSVPILRNSLDGEGKLAPPPLGYLHLCERGLIVTILSPKNVRFELRDLDLD